MKARMAFAPDRHLACMRARREARRGTERRRPGCTFSSAHVENVTATRCCCIIAAAHVPEACVTWSQRKNVQMGSMRPRASLFLDCSSPTGNVFGKRKRSTFRSEEKRDRNRWERRNDPSSWILFIWRNHPQTNNT